MNTLESPIQTKSFKYYKGEHNILKEAHLLLQNWYQESKFYPKFLKKFLCDYIGVRLMMYKQ